MSDEVKIWVSECPNVGDRIVFNASSHKGESQSSWQDARVIEVGYVPNSSTKWIVKVEYPTTKRKWGKPILHRRWCAAAEIVAVIRHDEDVKVLERMFKL
jgi:hypothetical protein